MVGVVGYMG
jgi:hypothetical protein